MAKVLKNGLLSGTLGDKTYVVVNGKQYIRSRSTLNKKKMLANPKYQRFFNHGLKTGIASKYLALMFKAFEFELKGYTDINFNHRLTSEFRKHIMPGETVSDSSASFNSILKKRENIASLNSLITNDSYRRTIAFESNFDLKTETLTTSGILLLVHNKEINYTHFRIRLAVARIDFDHQKFDVLRCQSDLIAFEAYPLDVQLIPDKIPQTDGVLCYASIFEYGSVINHEFYPNLATRYNNVHLGFLED